VGVEILALVKLVTLTNLILSTFMKLWDGKKWLIKEVAKKVCHK